MFQNTGECSGILERVPEYWRMFLIFWRMFLNTGECS